MKVEARLRDLLCLLAGQFQQDSTRLASLLLLQAKPVEVAALVVVVRQPVHVLRPRQAHARPIQGLLLLLRGSPRLLHEPPHRGGSSLEGVRRLAGEPPGGCRKLAAPRLCACCACCCASICYSS